MQVKIVSCLHLAVFFFLSAFVFFNSRQSLRGIRAPVERIKPSRFQSPGPKRAGWTVEAIGISFSFVFKRIVSLFVCVFQNILPIIGDELVQFFALFRSVILIFFSPLWSLDQPKKKKILSKSFRIRASNISHLAPKASIKTPYHYHVPVVGLLLWPLCLTYQIVCVNGVNQDQNGDVLILSKHLK